MFPWGLQYLLGPFKCPCWETTKALVGKLQMHPGGSSIPDLAGERAKALWEISSNNCPESVLPHE